MTDRRTTGNDDMNAANHPHEATDPILRAEPERQAFDLGAP
jgi:hypothetical protein